MVNSTIMELGYAALFLWVLCRQPESPCEGRRTWRIKEFLCSPEIISITSMRGWREHNLLIPTFLKIDLVTGRFSLSQRDRCVVESLLLHQKCWHSISSSAKILFAFPWVISLLCKDSERAFGWAVGYWWISQNQGFLKALTIECSLPLDVLYSGVFSWNKHFK